MPDLEKQEAHFPPLSGLHGKPKNPLDSRIHHSNCFVRCLYNIPQGTMMLVLPGAVILMMGVIVLPWTSVEEGWSEGTQQAGLIFTVFGGVLFLAGLIYGCYFYYKGKPKIPSRHSVSPHLPKGQVELVGVYKIRQDGMSVPKDTFDNPPTIATIS